MENEYINRRFMIFSISEISNINFEEVLETSTDTIRKSINETKTFIKWDGEMPLCVSNLITSEGPYTYDEIITILQTEEWTDPTQGSHQKPKE
jgi:hypothetical protein